MNSPPRFRVNPTVLPIVVVFGALLLFDVGRYVVSGLILAVILLFGLAIAVLLVGLLVTLALPSRRRPVRGDVPATTSELIADFVLRLRSLAGRAPWRRPGRVMAGAAHQVRTQVAQLPTGPVAFSNIEARMSRRTLDRLDAWMPVEDVAYQLASDYALAHKDLHRTSRAITVVLIRDDSIPQNRVQARGSFRNSTDPQAVALARSTLTGPLAHGEADRDQHTILRIEEPEPLDAWLAPGSDGSTRLDPERTAVVPAASHSRAARYPARDTRPTAVSGPGAAEAARRQEATTVLVDHLVEAPTVHAATSVAAAALPVEPPTLAPEPEPVRPAPAGLRLFRIDPRTGQVTGEPHVIMSAGQASVGRTAQSDVWLGERHVSRAHAQLDRTDSGWTLTDVGSTWGTFVNGRAIVAGEAHSIRTGDVVEFGRPSDPVAATRFLVG